MSMEIAERDWKVLKRLKDIALNRYCQRVLEELEQISRDSAKTWQERYLDLNHRVHDHDRQIADAFNDLRRSKAVWRVVSIRRLNLLTQEELAEFTPEFRQQIEGIERDFRR